MSVYREMSPEEENFHLRKQIEQLMGQLGEARQRHTLVLPMPNAVSNSVWVVPLRVGEPGPLRDFSPDKVKSYRLMFDREWSDRGVFWRLCPFSTEPERVKP